MGGNSVIKRRRGFQQSPGGVHAAEKAGEGVWGGVERLPRRRSLDVGAVKTCNGRGGNRCRLTRQ